MSVVVVVVVAVYLDKLPIRAGVSDKEEECQKEEMIAERLLGMLN
jgi:hypothetical protein